MKEGPLEFEPQRIADELGEVGSLLRHAEQAFQADLDESWAFRRLERRRRRAARVRTFAAVATLAVAAGGVTAWFHESAFRNTSSAEAEPLPVRPAIFAEEPGELVPVPAASAPTRSAPDVKRVRASAPPVLPSSTPERAAPSELECQEAFEARAFQRAAECFRARASGSGLEAEVALYRAARIVAESLGEPRKALGLLDEHRRRFPNGAMRAEVELLRVRSLNQSGRYDEALAASEALLATPAGRALSSELHFLRGQIFQDRHQNCAAAASEFVALLGEPGRLGDEAELRRAECLERLGRVDDARLAYQQYLRRNNPISADQARSRLGSLEGEPVHQGGEQ
jgi:tetratricopeptide (TPR) repeat protein